jgi:putative inorganic carbon (HCO3(-)) transporter
VAVSAARWLFLGLIVWAPWPIGSNRPWAWAILEVGIFLAAGLWVLGWMLGHTRYPGVIRHAKPALAVFGLWLAYLTLHWVPLPGALVALLSPQSAEIQRLAAQYTPSGDAWMTLSLVPQASFAFWLKSVAYMIAFALTIVLANTRERAQMIAYAIVLGGLLQAVYGGLMHLSGTDLEMLGAKFTHSSQASGAFVNRNHLAGCLEMALAVGIGLMMAGLQERGQRTWRQFWRDMAVLLLSGKAPLRIFLIVMVISLVMTRSRMGNTAFFSSLLVAGGIMLLFRRYATRSTIILVTSLIVVDIFIVGAWFGVEKTVQRIQQTTTGEVEERVEPSKYALDMVRDYPVFGAGPGTFYTTFSRYRGPDVNAFFDFAHNDYVQLLVEAGAVGIVLVGSLPLMALWCAILALARRRDQLARGFAFSVIMGVTAIGIHSTVDFNLQVPANAFVFVILLAFGWIALYLDRSTSTATATSAGSRRASRSGEDRPASAAGESRPASG